MWYAYKNFMSQFYLTISLMMYMSTQWYWSCRLGNSIKDLHNKNAVMRWPFPGNAQWIYLYHYHNLCQRREPCKWDRQVIFYLLRWMFVIVLKIILQKSTAFRDVISSQMPFQTSTQFQFSGNKWLAVVFQCTMGNHLYILPTDNKPVISHNKPKLELLC